jgi:hypothetical protein
VLFFYATAIAGTEMEKPARRRDQQSEYETPHIGGSN